MDGRQSDSWLTVASGASGTGSGSVGIAIAANAGAARAGTLTIGGQTVTISQSAPPACSVALSPTSQAVTADGASVSVGVTADASCGWSAASQNSWLAVTGGTSGVGSGTVAVAVAPAPTGSSIGGQSHGLPRTATRVVVASGHRRRRRAGRRGRG